MKYGQRTYAAPPTINTAKCKQCKFYDDTVVFELCTHPTSEYRCADGKIDWHTISHMRTWECGETAVNFAK